jgi:hypothetical protein
VLYRFLGIGAIRPRRYAGAWACIQRTKSRSRNALAARLRTPNFGM